MAFWTRIPLRWSAVAVRCAPGGGDDAWHGTLPPGAPGQWCVVRVRGPAGDPWWARLELTDDQRGHVVRAQFLASAARACAGCVRQTLVHVPDIAEAGAAGVLGLRVYGTPADGVEVSLAVLPRWRAAIMLLWQGRRLIAAAWRGETLGFAGRLRAMVGQAPARAGEAPPYSAWIKLCEAQLPGPPAAPALDVQAVIFPAHGPAAEDATRAALAAQTMPSARAPWLVGDAPDWSALAADWLLLLRAGDVLAPDALAWMAHAAAIYPGAAAIVADFDSLAADGERTDPVFLPAPDALLLRTGLPTRGPLALRRPAAWPAMPQDAIAARGVLAALRPDAIVHVPRILAHCRPEAAPAAASPASPPAGDDFFAPSVVALVPSAARSSHVESCVRACATATSYPRLRVDVLLSAPEHARGALVRRLQSTKRVHVRPMARAQFNYAAVNNAGAAGVDADLLLLLNDDVAPLQPGWLDAMVAQMRDPRVGIVGARLLYGNGLVQHEGVIMGLAGLCEHAGRLRPAGEGGAHGIGRMTRQVSAVTAACMLVRSKVYRDLGGMDEGFAVALNDADFCLRAQEAGWRIVYCAEAELYHFESLSLGRHYEGARAGLEKLEVRRLRARWAGAIAADPFYNPQAALEPGREWQPAFPPRCGAPVPRAANPAAVS